MITRASFKLIPQPNIKEKLKVHHIGCLLSITLTYCPTPFGKYRYLKMSYYKPLYLLQKIQPTSTYDVHNFVAHTVVGTMYHISVQPRTFWQARNLVTILHTEIFYFQLISWSFHSPLNYYRCYSVRLHSQPLDFMNSYRISCYKYYMELFLYFMLRLAFHDCIYNNINWYKNITFLNVTNFTAKG
jgi:hypothetical protein